jgi:hypothetical protein
LAAKSVFEVLTHSKGMDEERANIPLWFLSSAPAHSPRGFPLLD